MAMKFDRLLERLLAHGRSRPRRGVLPFRARRARTQRARCSSSAPSNSGTETSQAACGWPKSPPTAPPTSDTRRNRRRSRRHRENRRLVRLRRSPPIATMSMHVGKTAAHLVRPPSLLQPQRMGARRLPRAASQEAGLSRWRFNRRVSTMCAATGYVRSMYQMLSGFRRLPSHGGFGCVGRSRHRG